MWDECEPLGPREACGKQNNVSPDIVYMSQNLGHISQKLVYPYSYYRDISRHKEIFFSNVFLTEKLFKILPSQIVRKEISYPLFMT